MGGGAVIVVVVVVGGGGAVVELHAGGDGGVAVGDHGVATVKAEVAEGEELLDGAGVVAVVGGVARAQAQLERGQCEGLRAGRRREQAVERGVAFDGEHELEHVCAAHGVVDYGVVRDTEAAERVGRPEQDAGVEHEEVCVLELGLAVCEAAEEEVAAAAVQDGQRAELLEADTLEARLCELELGERGDVLDGGLGGHKLAAGSVRVHGCAGEGKPAFLASTARLRMYGLSRSRGVYVDNLHSCLETVEGRGCAGGVRAEVREVEPVADGEVVP